MDASILFILFVIFLAFVFDFTNGFHDAANSVATIIYTGVLTPKQAILWAAFFNFIAFLFFELSVAKTIGTGLIDPKIVDPSLVFSALTGAIIWNLVTWYYGLPSSSSHALIGGLAGAALVKGGVATIKFSGFTKVMITILVSPLIGIIFGFGIILIIRRLTHSFSELTKNIWFKRLQLASAALLSLSHGGNDAQKTMGIVALLLYSGSWLGGEFYVPFWVVISCHIVMGLGTLAGGWKIIKTMGEKITHLDNMRGCCAEAGAASIIFAATHFGVPVSTTHTLTGTIAGVGISGTSGTQWKVIRRIFLAWMMTIPSSGIIAAISMSIF